MSLQAALEAIAEREDPARQLSLTQAATLLQWSRWTVRRLILSGEIPIADRRGRRVRIMRADVLAYQRRRQLETTRHDAPGDAPTPPDKP